MKINKFVIDNDDDTEFEITGTVDEDEAKRLVEAVKKYLGYYGDCSNCGYKHKLGVCADCGLNHPPHPEALTICSRCGKLHQFDANLRIHPIDMPPDIRPEVRAMILQEQKRIRERFS